MKITVSQGWEPSEIEKLIGFWNMGMSASEIEAILKRPRNSILGKIHRLRAHPKFSNYIIRPLATEKANRAGVRR